MQKLNIVHFLDLLTGLHPDIWSASKEGSCIHLRRQGSETIFSPLTAVYFHLTGKEIHRGSFWVEELTAEFAFDPWEILEISYAHGSCDLGSRYNRRLRRSLLLALRLSLDRGDKG